MFKQGSDVIDCLLNHVYQKSISELLSKFLNIQEHDYEGAIAQEISKKQAYAVQKLLDKLGPESSEEDNLNGSIIIGDMLEIKEFYHILSKK